MKINKLAQRLKKDRPMTMISLRVPDDVLEDLKRVAPLLGFTGYQALVKAYIGQGLRVDVERLKGSLEISALVDSLRKQGVTEDVITAALSDAKGVAEVV